MRFCKHNNIDKQKWDRIVRDSVNSNLYFLSWYLDAACPKWDAIIWGDYEAILPLPTKKWWFVKKVYQPFFVQQTGILSKSGLQVSDLLDNFFSSNILNKYFSFRVQFGHVLVPKLDSTIYNHWHLEQKRNFLLDLNEEYKILYFAYNDNRKRNLKKAISQGWHVEKSRDIEFAIEMYQKNQAPKQQKLGAEVYDVLRRIFLAVEQKGLGELLVCKDLAGNILSYAFFVNTSTRVYYLFGTMNSEGRKHSAISLLFDDIIRRNANENKKLDFEGGNLEGIGRFFASFGAKEEEYTCVWK